eukprot:15367043-Ditylum_brightwellii.AAC.2
MICPLKTVKSKCNNVVFVDNTTLFHILCQTFSISCIALMAIVKYDMTLCGRYLWTSGGWLEYMKTQYCTLIWSFKQHRQPYLNSKRQLPENNAIIKGADGSNTKLKRFDVDKGVRMLGVQHTDTPQQNT